MGRLRRAIFLRELGIELPRTKTPEEEDRAFAALAAHVVRQRRLTLTHGFVTWVWDDEDKLRERARATVAAMREAKEKSIPTSGLHDRGEKPSRDPWKISFDCLARSRYPEDLAEFKRRLALFGQMVREEAARIDVEP